MLRISSRQIIKEAGPKEKKRAGGINFEWAKSQLSLERPGEEIPGQEIKDFLEKNKLDKRAPIDEDRLGWIERLNLNEASIAKTTPDEKLVIIVGSVLSSNSEEEAGAKIGDFNWYLVTFEKNAGSFGIPQLTNPMSEELMGIFNKLYGLVREEKIKFESNVSSSASTVYLSNEVVYDFGDGWRVVYVPAKGEIEEYPGLPNTSNDRVLEGNKNGLCLGSELKFYQDNSDGKIYSVRDEGNNPAVTIRIFNNELQEAKGKNNNPPGVKGAIYAAKWFESLDGLSYKNNYDFKNFPPTNIEDAKSSFYENIDSPYRNKWIQAWYKQGIPELDQDVERRIKENDPLVFKSGLGKKYNELVQPVVKWWCDSYIRGDSGPDVLFYLSTHEVYKTHKKLPEMSAAVKKLSEKEPLMFVNLGLPEIPEYKKYSDKPIRISAEESPIDILRLRDREWTKPYLDLAAKNAAIKEPSYFLRYFIKEDWAKPYLGLAAKNLAEKDPYYLLHKFSKEEWAQPYLDRSAEVYAEEAPFYFLREFFREEWAQPYLDVTAEKTAESQPYSFVQLFSEESWAKPHLSSAIMKAIKDDPNHFLDTLRNNKAVQPYLGLAAKEIALRDPYYFLRRLIKEEWAQPYRNLALESGAKKDPQFFIERYYGESWAEPYLGLATQKYLEMYPNVYLSVDDFLSKFSSKAWVAPYLEDFAKIIADLNPDVLLYDYSGKEWAQPYLDLAAKNLAKESPEYFLRRYSSKPWAQPYLELARSRLNKNSSQNVRLLKLAKSLTNIGLDVESKEIISFI